MQSLSKDRRIVVDDFVGKCQFKPESAAASPASHEADTVAQEDSCLETKEDGDADSLITSTERGVVEVAGSGSNHRVCDVDAFQAKVARPPKHPTRSVSDLFAAQRAKRQLRSTSSAAKEQPKSSGEGGAAALYTARSIAEEMADEDHS